MRKATLVAIVFLLSTVVLASGDDEARLVLGGLDPVLLVEGERREGGEGLRAVHEGFRYHFTTPGNKKRFEADPEKYAVQIRGACPVRPDLAGKPDIFLIHEGRIYLFYSEHCREKFEGDPEGYLEKLPPQALTGGAQNL